MRKLILFTIIMGVSFGFGQLAMADMATVDALKQALSGNTIEGKNRHGTPLRVLHATNGTTIFELKRGGFSDRGKWWVKADGVVCYQWQKIGKGKERCNTNAHIDGEGRVVSTAVNGKTGKLKILKGNQIDF